MSDIMSLPPQPTNYAALQVPADPVGAFLKQANLQPTLNLQNAQANQLNTATQMQQLQLQRQQQYYPLLQQALANPTPQNFATLTMMYPDQHEALTAGWNTIHTAQQQAEIDQGSRAYAALASNRPDIALDIAQTHLTALQNSGADSSNPTYQKQLADAQRMVNLIQTDPTAAQGQLGAVLSSILGPQDFSNHFSTFMTEPATIGTANAAATTAEAKASVAPQQAQADLGRTQADIANTQSEIQNRAAQFGLDAQQFQTNTALKLRELNYTQNVPNMRGNTADIVNSAVQDSVQHGLQADRIGTALTNIQNMKQNGQWTQGTLADMRSAGQSILGTQDDWNSMRTEYNALRNGSIFSSVQNGRTTDSDLKVINQGFPSANASPAQIEQFLTSMRNVELRQARIDEGKSAWGSAYGYMGPATHDAQVGGQQVAKGTSFADFNKARIATLSTSPSAFDTPTAAPGVQVGTPAAPGAAPAQPGTPISGPLTGAAARYNKYVGQ